jgi:hypothetical protein
MSRKKICALLILTIISFAALVGTANALTYKELSTADLVRSADAICIGTCTKKSSRFIDHHIETTVEIAVSEYLKGDLGKTITLTIMGGEIETPLPLAQHVMGTPNFVEKEEVLLFLTAPRLDPKDLNSQPPSAAARFAVSPDVVGWFQGKYTILTDSATGEKKIAKFNFDNMSALPNDEVTRKLYRALENTRKTEGDTAADQFAQEIENILLVSKEDSLAVQRLSANALKPQGKDNDAAQKKEPEIVNVGPIKTLKIDADQSADGQRAVPPQSIKAKTQKRVEAAPSNLKPYFDRLQSLESFKQTITDIMAK